MIDVHRDHNQFRTWPRLPGTDMPARGPLPRARIYRPARSVTQSAPQKPEWILEFEPTREALDALMGWAGGGDPISQVRLHFHDLRGAIGYAEQHGWRYEVEEPLAPRRKPKLAEQLRYELGYSLPVMQAGMTVAPSPDSAQLPSLDVVEEASREPFPASDPPAWTGTVVA